MRVTQKNSSCFVCDREIVDGKWFARFPVSDRRVLACRPWCVEKFLDNQGVYTDKVRLNFVGEMTDN
jgi:hypothetical protein